MSDLFDSGRGIDAAYARLYQAAMDSGAEQVRLIALDLTPEARADCIGMAMGDVEYIQGANAPEAWPARVVLDVLVEIQQNG